MRFFSPAAAATLALFAGSCFAQTASCPQAAEQLPELLASAMQRVGHEGEVRAEFEVNARGRVQAISVDGYRRYRAPVRSALESLECQGGTPRRYVLNIRFADPSPPNLAAVKAPGVVALP